MRDVRLLDTSAWIEYLRKTGSPAHHAVKQLLNEAPHTIAMTEPVMMELLVGAQSSHAFLQLQSLCSGLPLLAVEAPGDWQDAAAIYRTVRSTGKTVRKTLDCLIAAVAIRSGATLVHRDADFTTIAAAIPSLKVDSLL